MSVTGKRIVTAMLAHVDAGKTTLSEAVLYNAGSIRKLGRVDNKDAYLDNYELERSRGITIFSKQAVFEYGDMKVTLLDTPGHVDFSAEMERTLQVIDYAILLISAADGVTAHTRTLWRLCAAYDVPVFLFVNKMDYEGADKSALLSEIKKKLDSSCVDFSEEEEEDNSGFYEQVAMTDEALLEEFLQQGVIEKTHIIDKIKERKIFPCYFGSALKLQGIHEFLEGLNSYTRENEYGNEFSARVFKITRDNDNNRLTYVKVTGGVLRVKDCITENDEKVNQIRIYSGNKYITVNEVQAGEVCALTGLGTTYAGQGLGACKEEYMPILEPVLTYKIQLPEEMDAMQMLPKLKQLEEEEPELHILWNETLQEIQAQIMGEVQIEILESMIQERYGVAVSFTAGNIVYKETIANTVEGVGHFEPLRHYAEVHVLIEPLEAGSGIVTDTDCSEDVLDKNWQRLILTHLNEKEHRGVLTGAPLTDVKITLVSGRAHNKHTEGGDFRQATYRAVRQGLKEAQSVLLEPYYEFRIEIPEKSLGRAMTDLERMHAVIEPPLIEEGEAVLTGTAPVALIRDYHKEIIAYTKGVGRIFCTLKGYYKCHNEEEVIAATGYDSESDLENPTGSVFCANGAGYVVPWNEVKSHMHMECITQKKAEKQENVFRRNSVDRLDESLGVEEIDAILERTFYANKSSKTVFKRKTKKTVLPVTRSYGKTEKRENYLLVDGYNIIYAWEELKELARLNIDGARGRLLDIMCNYQGMKKNQIIVVFDAYRVAGHATEYTDYHNIHVVYTKEAETADQYIERFAHENGRKYNVTVATSDGLEQIIIRGQGCALISAREFEKEVKQAEEDFRKEFL